MPKQHTATGWWGILIDSKAGGRVDFLARLVGVSDRTLRRWRTGDDVPTGDRLKSLRKLAGKTLVTRTDAPEFFNAQASSNK